MPRAVCTPTSKKEILSLAPLAYFAVKSTILFTEHLPHCRNDIVGIRDGGLFETVVIGDRDIQRRYPQRCGIQFEEAFLVDDRHHFGAHPDRRFGLFDDHGTVGVAHRARDACAVHDAHHVSGLARLVRHDDDPALGVLRQGTLDQAAQDAQDLEQQRAGDLDLSEREITIIVATAAAVLLLVLLGADTPTAVAATLICRLATLWFAVLIGLVAVVSFELRGDRLAGMATTPVESKQP